VPGVPAAKVSQPEDAKCGAARGADAARSSASSKFFRGGCLMRNQDQRLHLFSHNEVNWPEGPMNLWQKIGGVLVIAMLLVPIALATMTEEHHAGWTSVLAEQGHYP
jgi:hypothetical protein